MKAKEIAEVLHELGSFSIRYVGGLGFYAILDNVEIKKTGCLGNCCSDYFNEPKDAMQNLYESVVGEDRVFVKNAYSKDCREEYVFESALNSFKRIR
ncbi:MAG: hypothetical protein ACOCQR_02195 [bacterium]